MYIGRAWAAVSTEGLLIYSLDSGVTFDPFDLASEVTPEGVERALVKRSYSAAVMMSLRLNEKELIAQSVEAVPIDDGESFLSSHLHLSPAHIWVVLAASLDLIILARYVVTHFCWSLVLVAIFHLHMLF